MKIIFVLFLLLTPRLSIAAQTSITVEIVGLENNKGRVIVALLDKHEKDLMDTSSYITDNKCTVIFEDVMPGKYAIRFFHDENQNEELDTNFLGIPKEGFGFSNDAMGKFGPKDFSEWLFEVSDDTKIKMTANYMF